MRIRELCDQVAHDETLSRLLQAARAGAEPAALLEGPDACDEAVGAILRAMPALANDAAVMEMLRDVRTLARVCAEAREAELTDDELDEAGEGIGLPQLLDALAAARRRVEAVLLAGALRPEHVRSRALLQARLLGGLECLPPTLTQFRELTRLDLLGDDDLRRLAESEGITLPSAPPDDDASGTYRYLLAVSRVLRDYAERIAALTPEDPDRTGAPDAP